MIHQNLESEEIQHLTSNQLHQMITCNFRDGIDKIMKYQKLVVFQKSND